jgi:hypothetical protein
MELPPFFQKHFPAFPMFRVGNAAVHRADPGTLGLVKGTNTFSALIRVDHIDDLPFTDGLIRALRLASSTANALVSYFIGHNICFPPIQPNLRMPIECC